MSENGPSPSRCKHDYWPPRSCPLCWEESELSPAHGSPSSKLKTLLERITPLPWHSNGNGDIHGSNGDLIGFIVDNPDDGTQPIGEETSDFNDEYLVHAANVLPQLVEAVRRQCADIYHADLLEALKIAEGKMENNALTKSHENGPQL